jgi:hypothetical protein
LFAFSVQPVRALAYPESGPLGYSHARGKKEKRLRAQDLRSLRVAI